MPTLVTGEINFPDGTGNFSNATLRVQLESIGMMDMPAEVVAESIQQHVAYTGQSLSFEVDGDVAGATGPFNLRVHLSMSGADDIAKGDYITKRSHTVLKERNPDYVQVEVEKV